MENIKLDLKNINIDSETESINLEHMLEHEEIIKPKKYNEYTFDIIEHIEKRYNKKYNKDLISLNLQNINIEDSESDILNDIIYGGKNKKKRIIPTQQHNGFKLSKILTDMTKKLEKLDISDDVKNELNELIELILKFEPLLSDFIQKGPQIIHTLTFKMNQLNKKIQNNFDKILKSDIIEKMTSIFDHIIELIGGPLSVGVIADIDNITPQKLYDFIIKIIEKLNEFISELNTFLGGDDMEGGAMLSPKIISKVVRKFGFMRAAKVASMAPTIAAKPPLILAKLQLHLPSFIKNMSNPQEWLDVINNNPDDFTTNIKMLKDLVKNIINLMKTLIDVQKIDLNKNVEEIHDFLNNTVTNIDIILKELVEILS
jgi:hypothetical protein